MRQILPTTPPLEKVYEPPFILEPVALGAGCGAGFMGWVIHRTYFVGWYWYVLKLLKNRTLPWEFDAVYAFVNLNFALNHALLIGLLVGFISRWYPYRLVATAILLSFLLKNLHDAFDLWGNPRRPNEVVWVGLLLWLIYGLLPFIGAHIGQLLQRKYLLRSRSEPIFLGVETGHVKV